MNILKRPIKFMTKTIEDVENDNYILFQSGPVHFELKSGLEKIGSLAIETQINKGQIGNARLGVDEWMFTSGKERWPKRFLVTKNNRDQYSLRFSLLGFTSKVDIDGVMYVFSAGGRGVGFMQAGVISHQWTWKDTVGDALSFRVRSGGSLPQGISVVSKNEVSRCRDGLLLILFARYLQYVYTHGF